MNIVQVGDPVLRTAAKPLTKAEILDPEIQQLIAEMSGGQVSLWGSTNIQVTLRSDVVIC